MQRNPHYLHPNEHEQNVRFIKKEVCCKPSYWYALINIRNNINIVVHAYMHVYIHVNMYTCLFTCTCIHVYMYIIFMELETKTGE